MLFKTNLKYTAVLKLPSRNLLALTDQAQNPGKPWIRTKPFLTSKTCFDLSIPSRSGRRSTILAHSCICFLGPLRGISFLGSLPEISSWDLFRGPLHALGVLPSYLRRTRYLLSAVIQCSSSRRYRSTHTQSVYA